MNSENHSETFRRQLFYPGVRITSETAWTFGSSKIVLLHEVAKSSGLVQEQLSHFIDSRYWPPNFPYLNPLDYSVWSVLEAKACSKHHRSVNSLMRAL